MLLKVYLHEKQILDYDLSHKKNIIIGRDEASDILLENKDVSRRHASIEVFGDNFVINDLGSSNGVKINGKKITFQTVLKDSDNIEIGSYKIVVSGLQSEEESTGTYPENGLDDFGETTGSFENEKTRVDLFGKLIALDKEEFLIFEVKDDTTIGRHPDSTIQINESYISSKHARIYRG